MSTEKLEQELKNSKNLKNKILSYQVFNRNNRCSYNPKINGKLDNLLERNLYKSYKKLLREREVEKLEMLDSLKHYIENTLFNRTGWMPVGTVGFELKGTFMDKNPTKVTCLVERKLDGYHNTETGFVDGYETKMERMQDAFLTNNEKALTTLHECLLAREEIFNNPSLNYEKDRKLAEEIVEYLKLAPLKEKELVKVKK